MDLGEKDELSPLTGKQRAWLAAYLDPDKAAFSCKEAAKIAGYRCRSDSSFETVGYENLRKLRLHIKRFFDECGLSPDRIKGKVSQLLDAREVKVFNGQDGIVYSAPLEALNIQLKAARLGAELNDMLSPTKIDLGGNVKIDIHFVKGEEPDEG